jgi:hypothetical protein
VRPLPHDDAPSPGRPRRFESPAAWDDDDHVERDRRDDHGDRGWRDEGRGWEDESYAPPGYAAAPRDERPEYDRGGYPLAQSWENERFSGWSDRTDPAGRGGRRGGGWGRGGGRGGRDGRGLLPESLPVVPTMLTALVAVILAFILGRSTGGGDDSQAAPRVQVDATTTTASTAAITHTVQRNETLSGIASQYGVSPTDLAAANNITDANHVFVGQKLLIPSTPAVNASTTTTRVAS